MGIFKRKAEPTPAPAADRAAAAADQAQMARLAVEVGDEPIAKDRSRKAIRAAKGLPLPMHDREPSDEWLPE
ncbi:hypothetical protein ACWDRR_42660 [Kitasatospora sp. NPDC003701]